VLADGVATLPCDQIPDLVDASGRFGSAMVRDGFRFFFLPRVRAQLAAEIRAQFEAFAATGLPLDHVNAHKHFHLHPTVLSLILSIGRDYGMRRATTARGRRTAAAAPWLALLRARLQRAGIAYNDYVLGLSGTGAMDEATLLAAFEQLPRGVVEMYHPP
jgi:hopanoid biosynthesis associated protein HpnK